MKAIKQVLQKDKEKYRVPRRVQDLIPIDGIWNDGIFHGGNAYSKTYRFSDIRFEVAESLSDALVFCNVEGDTVKIAVATSGDAMDLSMPVGYLVLTPTDVSEAVYTKVETVYALANAIAVETLVDTTLEIKPNFTLSGRITYYADGSPLAGVKVTLNNGMVAYTNEDGYYTFTGITSNYVVVTPHMTGAVNGAITSQDASMVLQAVTTDSPELSDYQRIAADVDGDGQLTAHDASYILRKSVGKIEGEFPGTGAEWVFDGTKVLVLSGDASNVDFNAILLGDVSGNWTSDPAEELE